MTGRTELTSDSTNDPRQDGMRRLRPATLIYEISQARVEKELRKRQAMIDGWEATRQQNRAHDAPVPRRQRGLGRVDELCRWLARRAVAVAHRSFLSLVTATFRRHRAS